MTKDAQFWTGMAPGYAKRPISDVNAYEQTLSRVRDHLSPEDRVIEFGAGTGSTGLRLAPLVARYLVTDFAKGMIDIADSKRAEADIPSLDTAVGTIADFADEDVTVAMAFNLFHLTPDMDGLFRQIFDLLPSGGLFIQKTPAIAKRWYLKPVIRVMALVGKAPGFISYLKPEDVDKSVRSAGFEIVETGLYPSSTPSRFVVARKP